MKTSRLFTLHAVAAASVLSLVPVAGAFAQAKDTTLNLDEVVVTAAPEARSKMKQSQSVSSLGAEAIATTGATSAAEVLRSIPGIRAEASSGDGNANITVRGVPISTGGSRYVQIQEDGLPVLLFGDFNFLTSDSLIRVDNGTDGVEVVRGGSASTMATNSPGGVINWLSNTGEVSGSKVGLSYGTSKTARVDFSHAGKLNDSTRFHFSGFSRQGEGVRATNGVMMDNGLQLRANMTTDLGQGSYVRFSFKYLKDKSPTLLTVPVKIDASGNISEFPGVDPRTYSPYSNGLRSVSNWGVRDGGTYSINDGLQINSMALGSELNLNLADGWNVKNNFRISTVSGMFMGLMPQNTRTAALPANTYQAILLGAKFNDMGMIVNDLKASKKFAISGGSITPTLGLFYAQQQANMDWDIAPLDVTLGGVQTSAYGTGTGSAVGSDSWRYKRYVDLTFNHLAPYAAVAAEMGKLNLDASVRADSQTVTGGVYDPNLTKADYASRNTAYSLGANYAASRDMAYFARTSSGASFKSDRVYNIDGAAMSKGGQLPVAQVAQIELGVKWRTGGLSNFLTLFNAQTKESNADITKGLGAVATNKYSANGLEYEFGYKAGAFGLNGGVTYTKSKVTDSVDASGVVNASAIGKAPNRQAPLVWQVAPRFNFGQGNAGLSWIGTSASKDEQAATVPVNLPGYSYVNAFANYKVRKDTTLGLSVNNLFNKIGYTEANVDGNSSGNRAAARSITGRTFRVSAKFNF